MTRGALYLTLAAILGAVPTVSAQDDPRQLALHARNFLKQYCHRCHNGDATYFNALGIQAGKDKSDEHFYLVAGKPAESYLWQRLERNEMPPRKEKERPSDAEKALFRKWIEVGAPAVPSKGKDAKFVSQADMLAAIVKDLEDADDKARPYLRYFTLTHLHNNPAIPDDDLRTYRAALSKALNSLSWKSDIHRPRAVDPARTVFAVDLRKLGWEEPLLWRAVLKQYPYGLHWRNHTDRNLEKLDQKLRQLSDCELAVIRADWFIVHATQPPLYHVLLKLPRTAGELEHRLEVDVRKNIQQGSAARGGFATSGVSGQNRLVERHPAAYGAYWKSYDFEAGRPNGNLPRYPLGPKFDGNRFARQAFEHDGGEIIFNLPNRLQGYLLVDRQDKRIDKGEIQVVSDNLKTSGTPAIVTGLSCMACHKNGTIPFKDQIREGSAMRGDALKAVRDLYPPHDEMNKLQKGDEKRFTDALEEACGEFLRTSPELKKKPLADFAEPVAEIARLYRLVDLDADLVAAELWLDRGAAGLRGRLETDDELTRLGLGALLKDGGAIKRHDWEAFSEGNSLFHEVARRFKVGTPLLP